MLVAPVVTTAPSVSSYRAALGLRLEVFSQAEASTHFYLYECRPQESPEELVSDLVPME